MPQQSVIPRSVKQANFKLPADLVRKIRVEAAERDVRPATVVAERLEDSFRRQPSARSGAHADQA